MGETNPCHIETNEILMSLRNAIMAAKVTLSIVFDMDEIDRLMTYSCRSRFGGKWNDTLIGRLKCETFI